VSNASQQDKRGLPRLARDRGGVAAFEFALIFPVFLLFVAGIVYFGMMLWTVNVLQNVASWAARCASLQTCPVPTNSTCTANNIPCYAVAKAAASGLPGGLSALNVSVNNTILNAVTCGTFTGLSTIKFWRVDINVPYTLFIPGGKYAFSNSLTLNASSCYPDQTYSLNPNTTNPTPS
jgi:Flp pilus assembly protein TadG